MDNNRLNDINGLLTTQNELEWLNVSYNSLQWFDYAFVPKSVLWLNMRGNAIEELGNKDSKLELLHDFIKGLKTDEPNAKLILSILQSPDHLET